MFPLREPCCICNLNFGNGHTVTVETAKNVKNVRILTTVKNSFLLASKEETLTSEFPK